MLLLQMVELCTQIAGAGLEQTTWLRRNLAVRENDSSPSMSGVTSVLTPSLLFSKDTDKQSKFRIVRILNYYKIRLQKENLDKRIFLS